MDNKTKIAGGILIALVIAYLLVAAMAFLPVRVVELHELRVIGCPDTNTKELCIELDFTKWQQYAGTFTVSILNEVVTTYRPEPTNAVATGRRQTIAKLLPLYQPLRPGEHQVIVVIQYKVNPLRTQTHEIRSETFTVTGPP